MYKFQHRSPHMDFDSLWYMWALMSVISWRNQEEIFSFNTKCVCCSNTWSPDFVQSLELSGTDENNDFQKKKKNSPSDILSLCGAVGFWEFIFDWLLLYLT